MSVFVVLSPGPNPALEAAIQEKFPADFMTVGAGQWLVAGDGIAKEVSDKLGITTGAVGTGIVVSVSGYFGFANNAIWEWLALKLSSGVKHAT